MPAAAVIPAPIAYIKVVAVKKPVVEFVPLCFSPWTLFVVIVQGGIPSGELLCSLLGARRIQNVYLEKIRVFKAGFIA